MGHQFLGADVYFISYLPSQLQWQDVFIIGGAGLAMSLRQRFKPDVHRGSNRRLCAMSNVTANGQASLW